MPFGLTNAPTTFQALMNSIFQKQLRRFVIVFFDDILVFSRSEQEHGDHLRIVFEILRSHSLAAKRNKCTFGKKELQFLGHIIGGEGIKPDISRKNRCYDEMAVTNND